MAASNQLSSDPAGSALPSETLALLDNFWPKVTANVQGINIQTDFKTQELPLARIKKIMKLDEDVKMISAEAPVLFAKACEIFISEISLRAWIHTEDNKRRTLQKNDVSQAVAKYDQFDFLIDIVPRDEIKPAKREDNLQRTSLMPDQVQYYFQLAQQTQQALQQPAAAASSQQQQQPIQIQTQNGQIVTAQPLQLQQLAQGNTQASNQVLAAATATEGQPQIIQIQAPPDQSSQVQQQVVQQLQQSLQQQEVQQEAAQDQAAGTQVFQQVVTPSGEVVHMPIQLTAAQLQAIQSQMQGKQPGQPIVIQTGAEQQHEAHEQPQPLFQVPIGADGQHILVQEDLSHEHGEQTLTIKGEH